MVNICIVNYNTTKLIEALIKSIELHVLSDYHIYIFDNSDKCPLNKEYNHTTIFDNTQGQYINFNTWLLKFTNKNKIFEEKNNFGSAKHAYSIDKCIELIDDDFILLDSDVLLKKDITEIIDDDYIAIGELDKWPEMKLYRILPYICYINVKKCKENNIHYFDENRMHGLNGDEALDYETGTSFLEDIEKTNEKIKQIRIDEYIVHLRRGSWNISNRSENFWLRRHRKLYQQETTNSQIRRIRRFKR